MDKGTDPRLTFIKERWVNRPELTQRTAASELKISQSAVCQYLNGTIPLNYAIIIKIAKLLNVSPVDIDSSLKF